MVLGSIHSGSFRRTEKQRVYPPFTRSSPARPPGPYMCTRPSKQAAERSRRAFFLSLAPSRVSV